MPTYATVSDVNDILQGTKLQISPTSKPTQSQVEAWIDQIEDDIHATLGTRYAVPVTGTRSVRVLKEIVAALAAWKAFAVAFPTQTDSNILALGRGAQEKLERLKAGTDELPDAVKKIPQTESRVAHSFDETEEPRFKVPKAGEF